MDAATRAAAVAFAEDRYPEADLVVVGGSAASVRRARSDIDLLVIGPAAIFEGDADEAAFTERWRGDLFEVFASTPEAFRRHQEVGAARFRPVSAYLLVEGIAVVDRGRSEALIAWTRELLATGPTVPPAELDARRYSITNTLDDLLDSMDAAESALLAALLVQRLAEFVLLAHGRWIASGRHLLRRLRALDAGVASRLSAALVSGDLAAMEGVVLAALAPYGGRLLEGYVR